MTNKLTTHIQLFNALLSGKKISCTSLGDNHYLCLNKYGNLVCQDGHGLVGWAIGEEWEIYEEYPLNFFEALDYLRANSDNRVKSKHELHFINKTLGDTFHSNILTLKYNEFKSPVDINFIIQMINIDSIAFENLQNNRYKKLED